MTTAIGLPLVFVLFAVSLFWDRGAGVDSAGVGPADFTARGAPEAWPAPAFTQPMLSGEGSVRLDDLSGRSSSSTCAPRGADRAARKLRSWKGCGIGMGRSGSNSWESTTWTPRLLASPSSDSSGSPTPSPSTRAAPWPPGRERSASPQRSSSTRRGGSCTGSSGSSEVPTWPASWTKS